MDSPRKSFWKLFVHVPHRVLSSDGTSESESLDESGSSTSSEDDDDGDGGLCFFLTTLGFGGRFSLVLSLVVFFFVRLAGAVDLFWSRFSFLSSWRRSFSSSLFFLNLSFSSTSFENSALVIIRAVVTFLDFFDGVSSSTGFKNSRTAATTGETFLKGILGLPEQLTEARGGLSTREELSLSGGATGDEVDGSV